MQDINMDLHLTALLNSVVLAHRDALGMVNGYLELTVPEAMARWQDLHRYPVDLDGTTLGSTLRELLWTMAANEQMAKSSLMVVPTPNRSARLVSADGVSIRVRKRPMSTRVGGYLKSTVLEDIPLFGEELGCGGGMELVIFWEPSLLNADLKSAKLAAVSDLEGRFPIIYAEVSLPAPAAVIVPAAPSLAPAPMDDFEGFVPVAGKKASDAPTGA